MERCVTATIQVKDKDVLVRSLAMTWSDNTEDHWL
jgi:hypothetical protein